jgi:Flp pilus assembly protein TadG
MSLVFVGFGFMAFIGASMLAIDIGMLMTARSQAQNSADAGALAGATALAYDDYDDYSATGPAVTSALTTARANNVIAGQVDVGVPDVEFLQDANGQTNRVRVTVYRHAERGNAMNTFIATIFGMDTMSVKAVAMAEASPADAMTCVKPFAIPDRWDERQTPPWDPTDTFDMVDNHGNPLANPDIYIGPGDPATYTGYNPERDRGLEIVLKANNDSQIAPSFYYPWDMVGEDMGADDYRHNIGYCNTNVMQFGDVFVAKPGNMVGPTNQGMDDLILRDPRATWNESTDPDTINSEFRPSPRLVAIPLFDPEYYDTGKRMGRNASLKFVNYLGFFIEEMRGNEVVGRIHPIGGLRTGNGPAPPGAFPLVIRLVQ